MTMTHKRRAGLTLMELLIVLAIIVALSLFLLPAINNQYQRWLGSQAQIQVNSLVSMLTEYNADHRGFPTTEQGLPALIFIPDNVGQPAATLQPPGSMTGTPGMMGETDMTGGMMGGSGGAGSELLNQPNPMNLMGVNTPGTTGMGAIDPLIGMPTNDPMTGGSQIIGGTATSTGTEPFHNPQLYLQQRRRSTPYTRESALIDPWGRPFRYDNSRAFNGLNRTGSEVPAVWSAGRDGIDGTDDDILGWDSEEAVRAFAIHQQQMQTRQGMGTGQQGFDPMQQQQQFGQPPMQPQFGQPPAQPQFGQPPMQPQFGQPPTQPQFGQPPTQPQFGQPPVQPPSF